MKPLHILHISLLATNQNTLSDLWEAAHNNQQLLDPQNPDHQPTADPDGDGWTNLEESVAGTDPFIFLFPGGMLRPDLANHPATYGDPINGIPQLITPEVISLTWPTVHGKAYQIKIRSRIITHKPIRINSTTLPNRSPRWPPTRRRVIPPVSIIQQPGHRIAGFGGEAVAVLVGLAGAIDVRGGGVEPVAEAVVGITGHRRSIRVGQADDVPIPVIRRKNRLAGLASAIARRIFRRSLTPLVTSPISTRHSGHMEAGLAHGNAFPNAIHYPGNLAKSGATGRGEIPSLRPTVTEGSCGSGRVRNGPEAPEPGLPQV